MSLPLSFRLCLGLALFIQCSSLCLFVGGISSLGVRLSVGLLIVSWLLTSFLLAFRGPLYFFSLKNLKLGLKNIPISLRLLVALGCFQAFLNLLNASYPLTEGDSLHSYLTSAKGWVVHNHIGYVSNAFVNGLYGPGAMVNLFGYFFGEDRGAMLLNGWAMGLALAGSVYAIARILRVEGPSALAAGLFVLILPDVWYEAASAKFDLTTSFLLVVSLGLLLRRPSEHRMWFGVAGFLAGGAAMSQSSAVLFLPMALLLLLRMRSMAPILFFIVGWGVASLPICLFNYMTQGNPIYPIGWGPWLHKGIRVFDMNPNRSEWTYVYFGGWLGPLQSILFETFRDRYHGFGPMPLLFFPVYVYRVLSDASWRPVGVCALAYVLGWTQMRQVPRDMLAILALLSIPIADSLWGLYRDRLERSARCVLITVALVAYGAVVSQNAMNAVFFERLPGYSSPRRDSYLSRVLPKIDERIPRWDLVTWINTQTPLDAKILALINPNLFYFDRTLLMPDDPSVIAALNAAEPAAVLRVWDDASISYIIAAEDQSYHNTPRRAPWLDMRWLESHYEQVFRSPQARIWKRRP